MYESASVLKESGYVDLYHVIKVDAISADYLERQAVSFHPETKYLSMDFPDSLLMGRNVTDSNRNRAANREQAVTATIECQVCNYQMQVGQ